MGEKQISILINGILFLRSLKSYDYIKSTKLYDGKNLTHYYTTSPPCPIPC